MSTRYLPAVSDGEILRVLNELKKKYETLSVSVHIEGIQLGIDKLGEEPLKTISKTNGYTISYFAANFGQFSLNYNVNHGLATSLVKLETTHNPNIANTDGQFDFLSSAMKKFAVPPITSIDGNAAEALAGFKSIETALAGAVASFAELQSSYLSKTDELRNQQSVQMVELRNSYDEETKKKEGELEVRGQELTKLKKELDDRSNTHARRDIRKEIKTSISDSLKGDTFASNVEGQRWYVRFAFLASILLVGAFAFYSSYILNNAIENKTGAEWVLAMKAVIGGISFVGFLLLYLRWETNWLNQRASYESNLASTRIDIDRASWVAESLLEWNRESPDKPIPNELLSSFTRRLFDWDAKTEDHQTASDSLASVILGSAARVQIGPSGANLEIDRKGLKDLSKM